MRTTSGNVDRRAKARVRAVARGLAIPLLAVLAACAELEGTTNPLFAGHQSLSDTRILALVGASNVEEERGNLVGSMRLAVYALRELDRLDVPLENVPSLDATLSRLTVKSARVTTLKLSGADDIFTAAVYCPDGSCIVTAGSEPRLRIWDPATGQQIGLLSGHNARVNAIAFNSDGSRLASASSDGTTRIWDFAKRSTITVLPSGATTGLAFSPDGARIATGSTAGTANIWDAATGKPITVLSGHLDVVTAVAFSPDGKLIATGSADSTARIWDASSGAGIAVLRVHGPVTSVAFSPDGKSIATASWDRTVRLWKTDGTPITNVTNTYGKPAHGDRVNSVVFRADGRYVVSASDDRTARIWHVPGNGEAAALSWHEARVNSASFSPDGAHIVTASDDNTALIWRLTDGVETATIDAKELTESVAFSSDGARVITASRNGGARIWDASNGKLLQTLQGPAQAYNAIFSHDGRLALATADDYSTHQALIWDIASGRQVAVIDAGPRGFSSVKFSPDDTRVASASNDGTAGIWDTQTGHRLVSVKEPEDGGITTVAFSPDGSRIFTRGFRGDVRIWNTDDGKPISNLNDVAPDETSISFSADGRNIIMTRDNKAPRVWSVSNGQEIFGASRSAAQPYSRRFAADGRRFVSSPEFLDHEVRILDAATGSEIAAIHDFERDVNDAAISLDGTKVATPLHDRTVRIWDVHLATAPSRALLPEACRLLEGASIFTRDEMRLAGLPDSMAPIDVCSGVAAAGQK